MGKVLAVISVLPSGTDVNLEQLEKNIRDNTPEGVMLKESRKEPFAFGISALKLSFLLSDTAGGTDNVEKAIKSLDGVGEVKVEYISLV
ncbi:MAG: elongation factor 1-beta [Promethearchaeota archaeon]